MGIPVSFYLREGQSSPLSTIQEDLNWKRTQAAFNAVPGSVGSVTSVALTMPAGFSVAGSPVTDSGTLAVTTSLSGFVKGNGSGFTAVAAINLATDVTGVLSIAHGGSNNNTFTSSTVLIYDGTKFASSGISTTVLNYLTGVTSNIQTQLDSKQPSFTVLPYAQGGTNFAATDRQSLINNLAGTGSEGDIFQIIGGNAVFAAGPTSAVTSVNGASGTVVLTVSNTSNPLAWSGVNLNIPTANAGTTGLLSSTDWNRFNNFISGSGAFLQGGNSFTDPAVLGTIDNFELKFIANNTDVANFATDGSFTVNNYANNDSFSSVITADDTGKTSALEFSFNSGFYLAGNGTFVDGAALYVPQTRTITINGVSQDLSANRTYNVGTVTSVAVSSTDLSVSGSPVTASGTFTLNINNSAVTYAKIQNVTGQRLLGRYSSSTGVTQEITLGSGLALDNTTGILTASGTGTVTSFSAGNLSPLFTTNVATATSTPALTFSLTNAGANTYFGNATGGSTAPSYTNAGALTKTDDTNVTMTLGGSPTVSLLAATSMTLGWTGQLSLARGGTGASTFTSGSVIFMGSTILSQDNSNFFYDIATSRLGLGSITVNDKLSVITNNLQQPTNVTTINTSGSLLENQTAATNSVTMQFSPAQRFRSQIWKTGGTPANDVYDFIWQGGGASASTSIGYLYLDVSKNGASYLGQPGIISFGSSQGVGINCTSGIPLQVRPPTSTLGGIFAAQNNAGQPALYVQSDGKVGIGISVFPSYALHVRDNTTAQTATNRVGYFTNSGATFNTTSGALTSYSGYIESISTKSAGGNNLTNIGLYVTASGADVNLSAQFDSGKVLVGTASTVLGEVHVERANAAAGISYYIKNTSANSNSAAAFQAVNSGGTQDVRLVAQGTGSALNAAVGTGSNTAFDIMTNNAQAASFAANGNMSLFQGLSVKAPKALASNDTFLSTDFLGFAVNVVSNTLTFPLISSVGYGKMYVVKASPTAGSGGTLVLTPASGDRFEYGTAANSTYTISTNFGSVTCVSANSGSYDYWIII